MLGGMAAAPQDSPGTTRRGLLVIGHGSRRPAANDTLRDVARRLAGLAGFEAVEPAFLELSEPSIAEGYGRLVRAGCTVVVAHPFFLFPGRHTTSDIPAQLDAASARHPGARWTVTEPLGLHPGVLAAAAARIASAEEGGERAYQPLDAGPVGDAVDP